MDNRRKQKRIEIGGANILIFDLGSAKVLGRIENLTNGGLLLKSEESVKVGKDYRISMSLPTVINEKSVIRCSAVSLWGEAVKNLWGNDKDTPGHYWTGFQFLDLSESDIKTIDLLIEQFGNTA